MFFGLGGTLCIYIVVPFLERYIQRINPKTKISLCFILIIFIVIDNVYSINNPHKGEGINIELNEKKQYDTYSR